MYVSTEHITSTHAIMYACMCMCMCIGIPTDMPAYRIARSVSRLEMIGKGACIMHAEKKEHIP